MPTTHTLPGRTVELNGKEKLYFSGTSYLGINHQAEYRALLVEGMQQYGGNYSSSRSSNLNLAIYEEAEQFISQWLGQEAVLCFSSGYQAGQALMQVLSTEATYLFAPKTHPAVWQSRQKVWQGSYTSWVNSLQEQIAKAPREVIIVSNSLDPLYAEKYSFAWLAELTEDKSIHVIIDDSHGLGVLGNNGEGIVAEAKAYLPPHVHLSIVGSIGKALGVPGGIISGSSTLIRQLQKSPYYTAASPIPPSYLFAFLQAQPIYQRARLNMQKRIRQFVNKVDTLNLFHYFENYPVFYTPYNALTQAVEKFGILSSFPYPQPDSTPVTRVVLNALHTENDIEILSKAVEQFANTRGV